MKSKKQEIHLNKLNNIDGLGVDTRFKKNFVPWNKGMAKYVDRICQFCGKTFSMKESQLKRDRGIFCSKLCCNNAKQNYSKRNKIEFLYKKGKTYKEIAQELDMSLGAVGHSVCTLKLQEKYGGRIRNNMDRQQVKQQLIAAGIKGCELCNFDRFTEVSHVVTVANGGKYELNNNLLLCPNCHKLFDYNLLFEEEINKLMQIDRIKDNLQRRLNNA